MLLAATRSGMTVALMALGLSFPAYGALGGALDSVQVDQEHMKATDVRIIGGDTYSVHEISTPTGTVIREYVSSGGHVFGVSWQGPFIPELRQLLGGYFEQYLAAAKIQRDSHVGRRPLNIHEQGLVVQTAGHMRAYSGRAYDPGLFPAGVSANDIR
jgi:hypothetical protein